MNMNMLICCSLLAVYGQVYGMPQRGDESGRGAAMLKKLMIFDPDFVMTKPPSPDPNVPKKR